MCRVLVVEHDRTVSAVIVRSLEQAGHRVDTEVDGKAAFDRVVARPPDLLILDLALTGMSGLELCQRVRGRTSVPIIILSEHAAEEDRIAGLEAGADDYVTKPFSPRELVLRARAVLRRPHYLQPSEASRTYSDGDLVVDAAAHQVTRAGGPVPLTVREYRLLLFLMQHPRTAFTREQLLARVWDWSFGDPSTVTVHVRRLREKIEADPAAPTRLVTIWGVGYRFVPAEPVDEHDLHVA